MAGTASANGAPRGRVRREVGCAAQRPRGGASARRFVRGARGRARGRTSY